jgi:hypothetical protein
MFDDEAALAGRIAQLEREKSAVAAEQAILTAALDATRRARETAWVCRRPNAARA